MFGPRLVMRIHRPCPAATCEAWERRVVGHAIALHVEGAAVPQVLGGPAPGQGAGRTGLGDRDVQRAPDWGPPAAHDVHALRGRDRVHRGGDAFGRRLGDEVGAGTGVSVDAGAGCPAGARARRRRRRRRPRRLWLRRRRAPRRRPGDGGDRAGPRRRGPGPASDPGRTHGHRARASQSSRRHGSPPDSGPGAGSRAAWRSPGGSRS